jgi:hypothetical protein
MARSLLDEQTFVVKESELPLDIPADPDAVYTVRPLTVTAARALAKQHTRQEFDRSQHRRIDVVDQTGLNDAIIDYVIVAWEGVGSDGKALCTLENKLRLPVSVQRALLDQAQVGDSAEVRAQSFREPPKLVSVLGR